MRETSFFDVTTQTNKYQVANVTDTYLPYLNDDFQPGDVNMDGDVTIADVSALIDYLLDGDQSAIDMDAANVNHDQGVTIADVSALIDILLGA